MTERAVDEPAGLDRAVRPEDKPGDPFTEFVDRYGPDLHRYCRRLGHDVDSVEDIVQETFIAAWQRSASFRGDSSLRTWLFAICTRKILDSHRRHRPDAVDDTILDTLPDSPVRAPEAITTNTAFLTALEWALHQLPPRQRASWVMREVESMTFPEIGRVLDLSPDAARGQHRRARTSLAVLLDTWR